MDLHVIGGFLGSGKTTAIINALKVLLAEGRRVGVITNDKGHYQVDTAFFGAANIPTAEVPGGCFRCNYGDFQERIAQLQREARPEVVFAESVGSCVDLVGPVLLPLRAAAEDGARVTYSVFTDIRLLRRHLAGLPLPFSDNIAYIFANQLEEANILVINKADLLPDEKEVVLEQAQRRFPDKMLLLQSSLTPAGVAPWLAALHAAPPLPPALTLDYDPYMAGSAELAWFDEQLTFTPPPGAERATVIHLIAAPLEGLRRAARPIAHLKFFIQDAENSIKLSFTAADESDWEHAIPREFHGPLTVIINARVQMAAGELRELVEQAMHGTLANAGVRYHASQATAFAPQVPV
ncbi:MAG TPA: GTP-binding protein [Anaerolineae bacterium]|nr:GTP-binding protein [Anaerolineae bacterium]HQH39377.1 GTP-binding protein [Anaerolineae bacterium]